MNKPDDLQELALRLSAFADVLNQHAMRLVQETGQSTQALRETATAFSTQAQQISRELVHSVGMQAREAIERHAADGMRHSGERLHEATKRVESSAGALQRELQRLGAAQNSLVWKSGLGLLLGSLLAVGGSGYFAWKSHQAVKQAEFPVGIVEAMRTGALTRCDGSICARIGDKPRRFGDKGQYAEVK